MDKSAGYEIVTSAYAVDGGGMMTTTSRIWPTPHGGGEASQVQFQRPKALGGGSYSLIRAYTNLAVVVRDTRLASPLFEKAWDLSTSPKPRTHSRSAPPMSAPRSLPSLHRFFRRNAADLDEKVRDFALAVQEEEDTVVYGGTVQAPKVLADIVESVAAAIYVDCQYDLQALWVVFRDLLEPIVTLDILQQQPQPVTMLFELCQQNSWQVDIKHWRKEEKDVASVYVDGSFIASASSEQKENARLHAAKIALEKLCHPKSNNKMSVDIYSSIDGTEIEGTKHKLNELCIKKRWPKPSYRYEFIFSELNFFQLLMV
ncbi:hypothetical protein Acr_23g0009220 [Actinidia rufa]|uniref:DRBM domain-containing protein n=1 Tax=Actinidia rufa TaxID=165716 RepID=A0A7J0GNZ3_9ERIC|nr:hypothetical protein Acr_23g0009220 [Actinidia rufa]